MIPDPEKEPPHPGHPSSLNTGPEHHHDLGLSGLPQLSAATSSRPDSSRYGSYMPADIDIATVGTSTRHVHRREEGPWLADLSRQYTPPHQTPAQPTPRISSLSYLPRIRAGDSAARQQRPPSDTWAFSQRSFTTTTPPQASLLPTLGHPHTTFDTHSPPDLSRVKHEPDVDLNTPSPRTGPSWTYVTHQPPPAPPTLVPFFFFFVLTTVLETC
jgi:hypothetical protein